MIRFIASTILFVLSNAIGLLLAALLLPDFHINASGFVTSLIFFSVIGVIIEPLIVKVSIKFAPAVRGGIALVTIFVGLWLTSWLTNGLTISGFETWLAAPVIVWLAVLLAGILLPMVIFRKTLAKRKKPGIDEPQ